jgi:hypothetical protein
MTRIDATYTTHFQDGTIVSSACVYDQATGQISDVEIVDADVDSSVEREYVTLPDGTEIEIAGDGESSE